MASVGDEALLAYFRLDPKYTDEADIEFARQCEAAARDYIAEAYGLSDADIAAHPSVGIAIMAVARDFFDNRSMASVGADANRTVSAVMACFDLNLV